MFGTQTQSTEKTVFFVQIYSVTVLYFGQNPMLFLKPDGEHQEDRPLRTMPASHTVTMVHSVQFISESCGKLRVIFHQRKPLGVGECNKNYNSASTLRQSSLLNTKIVLHKGLKISVLIQALKREPCSCSKYKQVKYN